jgi:hypothetical protein
MLARPSASPICQAEPLKPSPLAETVGQAQNARGTNQARLSRGREIAIGAASRTR